MEDQDQSQLPSTDIVKDKFGPSSALAESEVEVDVEAIMQQIRAEILAQKQGSGPDGMMFNVAGKRLPPEFYEHLYQAGMLYDELQVKMLVTKTDIPIIGPIIDRLRSAIHSVVLFYVNQVALKQIQMNRHLLAALNVLSAELESGADDAADDPAEHDGETAAAGTDLPF